MKFQNLLLSAVTAWLLVGASGAAMAVNNCEDGIIEGEVFEDIVIENRSCLIDDAVVMGSILVSNAEEITIVGTEVTGKVLVTQSRFATIAGNKLDGNLVVSNNERADVAANRVGVRTIRVISNAQATVKRNVSGKLICRRNTRLVALGNENRQEDCE